MRKIQRSKVNAQTGKDKEGHMIAGLECRNFLQSLFFKNKFSAKEMQELTQSSSAAGASSVKDFAKVSKTGCDEKHLHRDLLKLTTKHAAMPVEYWAQVPIHDPKSNQDGVLAWIPFLPLHEMMQFMMSKGRQCLELVAQLLDGTGQAVAHDKLCEKQ